MRNIGKGMGALALALATACGSPVDKYEEEFQGSFTDSVTDSTHVARYNVQKDSTGTPLEIRVYVTVPRRVTSEGDTVFGFSRIARFEGTTAESLYSRLVPKAFEDYRTGRD